MADFSCKHKFKMTESFRFMAWLLQFFKMLHLIKVLWVRLELYVP